MKRRPTIWLFVVMVFILPVTAWILLSWYERRIQQLPILGKKNETITNFHLTNQYNQKVSIDRWKNKIVVAHFFFTHCPVICPSMIKNLKKVDLAFKEDAGLQFSSFSVDPERDNPVRLMEYANQFSIGNEGWDLLTGDKRELYRLARNSFKIVATDGDGGPDDFIHSEKLVLVDLNLRIRGYYDGTSEKETDQLIIDINKLKHEN